MHPGIIPNLLPARTELSYDEYRSKVQSFIEDMPDEFFLEQIRKNKLLFEHEIDHLNHEDGPHVLKFQLQKAYLNSSLATLINGYILRNTFTKNNSKLALLGNTFKIMACFVASRIERHYEMRKFQQSYEARADDSAIKNAQTVDELKDYKKWQEFFIPFENPELKEMPELLKNIAQSFKTHPSTASRIEKIQKAIDNWKN